MNKNITQQFHAYKYRFILLFTGLIVCFHLFLPGLPESDDLMSMVIRSSGFHQSFKDGHLPVRWIQRLNENYGYPVTNFLYPLPFYLAEPFHLIGTSSLNAVKAVLVIFTLISGVGMFLWLKQLFPPLPAFTGGMIYLLSPFRFIDLYERGSLGEVVALGIMPFVFYFSHRYFHHRRFHSLLAAGLTLSALITAHNSLAFMFLPLIIGYWLLSSPKTKSNPILLQTIISTSLFVVIAASASAYFWLPALTDLSATRSGTINISEVKDHFIPWLQLARQIGPIPLIAFLASIVFHRTRLSRLFQIVFLTSLLFQLSPSYPLWQTLKLDRLIQFPFRFLSLHLFIGSYFAASVMSRSKKSNSLLLVSLAFISATLIFSWPHFSQVTRVEFDPHFFETNFDSTTNQKEFTPKWVQSDPTTFTQKPYTVHGSSDQYQLITEEITTQDKYLQLDVRDNIEVVFHTHYFPGWQVLLDDQLVPHRVENDGTIRVAIKAAHNHIRDLRLTWRETPLRQLSNTISALTLFIGFIYLTYILTQRHTTKTIMIVSLLVITMQVLFAIIINHRLFQQKFDPHIQESKYLNSQWVNPDSKKPLGDHGLYAWAGWSYIHGTNPILINPEMPPLGKYLIGWGIWLTQSPALVASFFSITFLLSLYLLSRSVINHPDLSLLPVALIASASIFTGSFANTMLDSIQLTFFCLSFLFLIKAQNNPRWFILTALMIGGVLSTKFFAAGILLIFSILLYYVLTRQTRQLIFFSLSLPLSGLVHLLSYTQFFILGGTLRAYLGVQKYIFTFYQNGTTRVPPFSYWGLVFFNQWRVWWGPVWGQFSTLQAKQWQLTWPFGALAAFISIYLFIKQLFLSRYTHSPFPPYHLLTSWLPCYSLFLSFIGGWPHYLLLFLPFSYILAVKIISQHHRQLLRSFSTILSPFLSRFPSVSNSHKVK